ncbi:Kunitz-type U19-barytoxin-Tl1a [Halotydeus destructor]|nr:Kunitz-type U19-barytoxin-Tl1a [Halotydeus destructor]
MIMATGSIVVLILAIGHQVANGQAPNPLSAALANAKGTVPECSLPPDSGECKAEFVRVYFDAMTKKCNDFYYGGCGGNANRFTSFKACYEMCSPHEATVTDVKVLSGTRYVIVPKPSNDTMMSPGDPGYQVAVAPGETQPGYQMPPGGGTLSLPNQPPPGVDPQRQGAAPMAPGQPPMQGGPMQPQYAPYPMAYGPPPTQGPAIPKNAKMKIKVIKYTNRQSSCCGGGCCGGCCQSQSAMIGVMPPGGMMPMGFGRK